MIRVSDRAAAARGFSLVEVTVAIGIFAFVAVGILGLLPAAMKIRADSAQETRAAMIAGEIFGAVSSAPDLKSIRIRNGPGLTDPTQYAYDGKLIDLTTDANSYLFGYVAQTTLPHYRYGGNVGATWTNGTTEGSDHNIASLARLSSSGAGANLRRVTVEVRSPATLPLKSGTPVTFSTLFYAP